MTIRPVFVPADPTCRAARQLIRSLYNDLASLCGDSPRADFPPLPFEELNGYRPLFVIAWAEEHPMGCGAILPVAEGIAEIKHLYVSPEWRRRGIARGILAELEKRALELGYHTLRIAAAPPQAEALQLYETCGYRRSPLFGKYLEAPLSVCFEKPLC